jgi:hypothetical protein
MPDVGAFIANNYGAVADRSTLTFDQVSSGRGFVVDNVSITPLAVFDTLIRMRASNEQLFRLYGIIFRSLASVSASKVINSSVRVHNTPFIAKLVLQTVYLPPYVAYSDMENDLTSRFNLPFIKPCHMSAVEQVMRQPKSSTLRTACAANHLSDCNTETKHPVWCVWRRRQE